LRNTKSISKDNERVPETFLSYVTAKSVYMTTRKSKSTKLRKKQGVGDDVRYTSKIKINGSFTLRTN
jgi:hypothetical protein